MLMQKIKIIFTGLALTMSFTMVPAVTYAQASELQNGANNASGQTTGPSIKTTVQNAINVLSSLVGVVAVVMLIVGGFRYITSGGDSNRVASAKNTIIYALIGVVIAALAQIIVNFVLNKSI
jgi:ABC-type sugar transport system permease subunit